MRFRFVAAVIIAVMPAGAVSSAPFGFSRDIDLAKAPCVTGGKPGAFEYGADMYTCDVPDARPFFSKLSVSHLPATGVCFVSGLITVEDRRDGAATRKAYDRLVQYLQKIEGEPFSSHDRTRETRPETRAMPWLAAIADGGREVRTQWLFLPEDHPDRLQAMQVEVKASNESMGKIEFTMRFADWPKCGDLPPPPPPPEYTIRIIPPPSPK